MIPYIIELLNDPTIKAGIMISKYFIQMLNKSLSDDVEKVLKTGIADIELRTAKNVLSSLPFEDEYNWKNGINRVITHLESAFELYNENEEFESACICGLYLSCMHKSVNNMQAELYKKIWLRIPVISKSAINYGQYETYVKMFFSDSDYCDIINERKNIRLKILDDKIEVISKKIENIGRYIPRNPTKPTFIVSLKSQKEVYEKEKRELQNIIDQRSTAKKVWDIVKPWYIE